MTNYSNGTTTVRQHPKTTQWELLTSEGWFALADLNRTTLLRLQKQIYARQFPKTIHDYLAQLLS